MSPARLFQHQQPEYPEQPGDATDVDRQTANDALSNDSELPEESLAELGPAESRERIPAF
jgi:hypothetical protein